MAKPPFMHWKQRRSDMRKPARRRVSSTATIGLLALFALMALPWLLVPLFKPAPTSDTHVVTMGRVEESWQAPFGKGLLVLRFVASGDASRVRVELRAADGSPRMLPRNVRAHLDMPGSNGRRVRVGLRPVGSALVSRNLVRSLPDRSVMVVNDGKLRHVFALDTSGRKR